MPEHTASAPTVVLVAFYNKKALGVRYLQAALEQAGYRVRTVFYKDFNSVRPTPTTELELEFLRRVVREADPVLVGLSVMSSMYLDTVYQVLDAALDASPAPVVCGGAFATMFPQRLLDRGANFVLRSDGEQTLPMLADALRNGTDFSSTPSLCWKEDDGQVRCNEIGGLTNEVDRCGLPVINSTGACFIENNLMVLGDPQLSTRSYEVIASRGCPFTCSYCCCVNLARLYPQGVKHVRTRSVKSIIDELIIAKKVCKKLVFVHFYDEIFPNTPGWVDEFVVEYKKHIDLPFTIWSHPKMVDPEMLRKLKAVGLTEVIMGIQSGSPHIRKDVFHRYESNDDIIEATRVIHDSGVFWASYDFMLRHPFETLDTLKETYFLVKKMHGPFELQLHGLNFLPGTDIVQMAIDQGYLTAEEMDKIMYAPMEEQFGAYWHRSNDADSQMWYNMIYCLQFKSTRKKVEQWENDPAAHRAEINALYEKAQKLAKARYYYKKARVVLKSKL